jgi:hypothetical protein
MKALRIQERSREAEEQEFAAIKDAIRRAAGAQNGEPVMVDSNFALNVFVQSLMLITQFDVDEEWLHEIIKIYMTQSLPRIRAEQVSSGLLGKLISE